jgi:hypothetical protein
MTGKRFTRYWQDSSFRAAVDEQFALATAATEPGICVTTHFMTQRSLITSVVSLRD